MSSSKRESSRALEYGDEPAGIVRPCEDRIRDHTGQGRGGSEQSHQLATRSTLQFEAEPFAIGFVCFAGSPRCDRGRDEVVLCGRQAELCRRRPATVVVEPRALQQVAGVAAGRFPLVHGNEERCLLDQIVAVLIDPVPQSMPLGEQGLVGDLDRRAAGCRIAIEREEAVAREGVDHVPQGDHVDVERDEFGGGHASSADDVA